MSDETIEVSGLGAPARIAVDRWGIPHIRADSLHDLFFAQGFNAARDRLWQIDLWRKRGLGLLAADFGPGFLAQDYASRLFLYRGDMAAEWASYAPDAQAICAAFTAGINAYVALTEREPARLPPEFALLGTRPARWRPEDVVRIRSHSMTRNGLSEILRAHVLSHADLATDLLRKDLNPPVTPRVAEGMDLGAIGIDAATLFKLATTGVTFTPERLAAPLADAWQWTNVTDLGEVTRAADLQGSNNWAVAGSRTVTGRPIFASDPHRTHSIPALRYLVHLSAPGFDAIGIGEPAVPGISMGHNGTAAFSVTIFGADQEDVYVYETSPDRPDAYRYGAGWEDMAVVQERFAVKGAPEQTVPLRFTRHGPVIAADAARRQAIAVRTVWSAPGSAAYLASLSGMRATSVEEYRAALRRWGAPSVNHVYADTSGTIAWMPAGFTPIRPNWDGLLPVPGDGRYEWAGFLDPDQLPREVAPARGYVATANAFNLPADWDHATRQIGFEWIEPSRANRVHEVLRADTAHSIAAACALQTDVTSIPARRLQALLAPLRAADEDAAAGLALFAGWDCRLSADSAAAALAELWWTRHLRPALLERLVPDAKLRALLLPGDMVSLLRVLEQPDARFGEPPAAARDRLLLETLAAAMRDGAARMGRDSAGWGWGRLHHAYFQHALAGAGAGPSFDAGPWPIGGSASTPMHTGYRPDDFR
ncbi:MAG: penicillin acylase family protein, partial [Rhodospirillales bacterium]|nr:penicillin acylase family protein [Rhodospirillales bacterium]